MRSLPVLEWLTRFNADRVSSLNDEKQSSVSIALGFDITVSVGADDVFAFRSHSAAANDFLAAQFNLIGERHLTKADLDRIVGLARGRGYAVLNCATFA
jgi:hypothetical protein